MGDPALSGRWASPGPDQVCPPLTPRPAASCLRRSPTSQTSLSGGGGGPGRSALPARTKGTGRPARPPPKPLSWPLERKAHPSQHKARGHGDPGRVPASARLPGRLSSAARRGPGDPGAKSRRGATHPTWERAAGSCWRCASTGRRAAATGPRAAPGPWQPPPLRIDRPERARRASAPSGPAPRAQQRCGQMWRRGPRGGGGGRGAGGPGGRGERSWRPARPAGARAECRRARRASDSRLRPGAAGETGNSSPTAGQDLSPPRACSAARLPALALSRSCQSRPRDRPLRGFGKLSAAPRCPPRSPPRGLLSKSAEVPESH